MDQQTDRYIDYLKTSDLNLASALFAMGYPIDAINPSDKIDSSGELVMDFYFRDNPQIREIMGKYHRRELRFEPNELFAIRKEILTRMKNEKNSKKLYKEGN